MLKTNIGINLLEDDNLLYYIDSYLVYIVQKLKGNDDFLSFALFITFLIDVFFRCDSFIFLFDSFDFLIIVLK